METKNFKWLTCPSLKPSDYYLFKEMKTYFNCNMQELLVLGIRLIYAGAHDPTFREWIINFITQIKQENLNYETKESRPEYKKFSQVMKS